MYAPSAQVTACRNAASCAAGVGWCSGTAWVGDHASLLGLGIRSRTPCKLSAGSLLTLLHTVQREIADPHPILSWGSMAAQASRNMMCSATAAALFHLCTGPPAGPGLAALTALAAFGDTSSNIHCRDPSEAVVT